MKKTKKFFAVLLAAAMVMGMSVTAFADDVTTKNPEFKDAATVQGVVDETYEENSEKKDPITVKAYQIITYNASGYYEIATPTKGTIVIDSNGLMTGSTKPLLTPTAENAATILGQIRSGEITGLTEKTFTKGAEGTSLSDGSKTFSYTSAELTAGTWLVVIEGSAKYLYNPAIISVRQSTTGDLEYGWVDLNLATDTWYKNGEPVYLKRSEPKITKTATDESNNPATVIGTQYNDILKFTITADIPDYITSKSNISYTISDTLTGLKLVNEEGHKPSATVGGKADTDLSKAVSTAIEDGKSGFTITDKAATGEGQKFFTDTFLKNHAREAIVITYYARVSSTAQINVDKLNNTATLSYSTNDTNKLQTKEAETKHYTFGIDTTVTGKYGTSTFNKTGEFIKINQDGGVSYSETTGLIQKTEGTELLGGAEFQLHIGWDEKNNKPNDQLFECPDPADKTKTKNTFTTSTDGRLEINGLDSDVDYYLVETKAPTGYSLNATPLKVRITATVNSTTGDLEGYSVKFGEGDTAEITNYSYTMIDGTTTLTTTQEKPSNPYGFVNTKIIALPSTGGIGTTIFTIGGCAIMVIAAGLFFATRRKSAK